MEPFGLPVMRRLCETIRALPSWFQFPASLIVETESSKAYQIAFARGYSFFPISGGPPAPFSACDRLLVPSSRPSSLIGRSNPFHLSDPIAFRLPQPHFLTRRYAPHHPVVGADRSTSAYVPGEAVPE